MLWCINADLAQLFADDSDPVLRVNPRQPVAQSYHGQARRPHAPGPAQGAILTRSDALDRALWRADKLYRRVRSPARRFELCVPRSGHMAARAPRPTPQAGF